VRIVSIVVFAAPILAQTAQISGTIRDSSNAVVPGAVVAATQQATNAQRTATTSAAGIYVLPALSPGTYRIEVRAAGFEAAAETGIKLDVGQSARLDFTLKPGNIQQSVTVNAETTLLKTDSATVSTVINRDFIENLPLNGRSFQSLIALTPGVVLTKATFGEQGQFSVNGQRANANYFTIDGVSANIGVSAGLTLVQSASGSLPGLGATGGTNTLVSVEALEEFRVQTSGYAPEYGRMPGAQITILTRSGTNTLHGALFDFFRNDALDATDWFANAYNLPKPALRQHDFGGVLGGPLLIPKLYNGRNRVAFFKDVIENKGGHKIFYIDGEPIEREKDLHILYRMTWFATPSDVTREANDGRGPADFKVSRGSKDKTLVEFKLAKNSYLEQNLEHQTKIYEKASDAKRSIKVIVYFTAAEKRRVEAILKKLNLTGHKDTVLVDARKDNKPSGSKARMHC